VGKSERKEGTLLGERALKITLKNGVTDPKQEVIMGQSSSFKRTVQDSVLRIRKGGKAE